MRVLTVVRAFGDHRPGDVISDKDEITTILGSHHQLNVVAADHPDPEPAPATAPAVTDKK